MDRWRRLVQITLTVVVHVEEADFLARVLYELNVEYTVVPVGDGEARMGVSDIILLNLISLEVFTGETMSPQGLVRVQIVAVHLYFFVATAREENAASRIIRNDYVDDV